MTGEQVRQKIRAKGFTYSHVARAIGESPQNLRVLLAGDNVKSETLERIAAAMAVNVAYFYNEQPIFTMADYVEYESKQKEITLLRQIIADKEALIAKLTKK